MFDFNDSAVPVRDDLTRLFERYWVHLAAPGSFWRGEQRVGIAAASREESGAHNSSADLPDAAAEAAHTISMSPQSIREPMVRRFVDELGESQYVELVGIASCVKGIDTVTRLLGCGATPLPDPLPGEPVGAETSPRLKRRSSWVAMAGPPLPRSALTAVPDSQDAMTALLDRLYMSKEELRGTGLVRGLTREQLEIVILAVSHENECFY